MSNEYKGRLIKQKLIEEGADPKLLNKIDDIWFFKALGFKEIDFTITLMVELIQRGDTSYYTEPTGIDYSGDVWPVIPEYFDDILYKIFNILDLIERNFKRYGEVRNVTGHELYKLSEKSDLYKVMTEYMGVEFKYKNVPIEKLKNYKKELPYLTSYDT